MTPCGLKPFEDGHCSRPPPGTSYEDWSSWGEPRRDNQDLHRQVRRTPPRRRPGSGGGRAAQKRRRRIGCLKILLPAAKRGRARREAPAPGEPRKSPRHPLRLDTHHHTGEPAGHRPPFLDDESEIGRGLSPEKRDYWKPVLALAARSLCPGVSVCGAAFPLSFARSASGSSSSSTGRA